MTPDPPDLRVSATGDGVAFWIHATPRASRNAVGGVREGALRVAVTAPPVEGRANAACVRALAAALGLRPAAVAIDPGAKGRRKRVHAAGDPEALRARLAELAGGS